MIGDRGFRVRFLALTAASVAVLAVSSPAWSEPANVNILGATEGVAAVPMPAPAVAPAPIRVVAPAPVVRRAAPRVARARAVRRERRLVVASLSPARFTVTPQYLLIGIGF
jgi:hypothetical protein